jgi:hypothetical protein
MPRLFQVEFSYHTKILKKHRVSLFEPHTDIIVKGRREVLTLQLEGTRPLQVVRAQRCVHPQPCCADPASRPGLVF